jgi:predicted phospho-2-dehydro-3-deoxyheptonate aldolase
MSKKQDGLNRIMKKGKAVIVPMDHGTSEGPIPGLIDMNMTVKQVSDGGASAVILHKGIIRSLTSKPACGIIMHLSASTRLSQDPVHKVIVGSVEEAVALGADAVSIHVNVGGNDHEADMLEDLGMISADCSENEMPLLAMMYARGKNVKDKFDPDAIALAARVGAELGADIIKCPYTGDVDTFKNVVAGCPVPVVIAGGPKCKTDLEVLQMVAGAMEAGAAGISIGRNIFQHTNPTAITKALRAIIVENKDVEEAKKQLGGAL